MKVIAGKKVEQFANDLGYSVVDRDLKVEAAEKAWNLISSTPNHPHISLDLVQALHAALAESPCASTRDRRVQARLKYFASGALWCLCNSNTGLHKLMQAEIVSYLLEHVSPIAFLKHLDNQKLETIELGYKLAQANIAQKHMKACHSTVLEHLAAFGHDALVRFCIQTCSICCSFRTILRRTCRGFWSSSLSTQ